MKFFTTANVFEKLEINTTKRKLAEILIQKKKTWRKDFFDKLKKA